MVMTGDKRLPDEICVTVQLSGLLNLLLNLDEETDLSICKGIVADILYDLTVDELQKGIDEYFYSIGCSGDLSKDHPREYKQLCEIFGCLVMK
jgi:hypothetical protein